MQRCILNQHNTAQQLPQLPLYNNIKLYMMTSEHNTKITW